MPALPGFSLIWVKSGPRLAGYPQPFSEE